jgi:hypothetical protein
VTVHYATADGTAVAPGDYTATSGDLTFLPGETTKTITVVINGDTTVEPDETFYVNLSNAGSASISRSQGIGTIAGDDFNLSQPGLSINDVTSTTQAGKQYLVFTVSLSAVSLQTITVNYTTADGTATAPGDYLPASGTLTFPAGILTRTITVEIAGKDTPDGNKVFYLNLSGAINANITRPQGTGTILKPEVKKKKEAIPADLIAQLRVTPDRKLPSTPRTELTYTLTVKNVGPGKASNISARLPIDSNLEAGWTNFSNSQVWVEKIVTDVEQPYMQLRFPDFESNGVVTSTIVFRTKIDNVPDSVIFTRATVKWNDDTAIDRITGSNAVRLKIVNEASTDETGGKVQFLQLNSNEAKPGKYTLFGDIYGPHEIVSLWYTNQSGESVALGNTRADDKGQIWFELDSSKLPQETSLVVAGFGNRTEVIGSVSFILANSSPSSLKAKTFEVHPLRLEEQKSLLSKGPRK